MKVLNEEKRGTVYAFFKRFELEGSSGRFYLIQHQSKAVGIQKNKYYQVDHDKQLSPYEEQWITLSLHMGQWATIQQVGTFYKEGILSPEHSVVLFGGYAKGVAGVEEEERLMFTALQSATETQNIPYRRIDINPFLRVSERSYLAYFGTKHYQSLADTFNTPADFTNWFSELWTRNVERLKMEDAASFKGLEASPTLQATNFIALISPFFNGSYDRLFKHVTGDGLLNTYGNEIGFLMMIFNEIPVDYAMQAYLLAQN